MEKNDEDLPTLSDKDKYRIFDLISGDATPLTKLEDYFLLMVSSNAEPRTPIEKAMFEFANKEELVYKGDPPISKADQMKKELEREQSRYEAKFKERIDWDDGDYASYYLQSEDTNDQELGRTLHAAYKVQREVDESYRQQRILNGLPSLDYEEENHEEAPKVNEMTAAEIADKALINFLTRRAEELDSTAQSLLQQSAKLRAKAQEIQSSIDKNKPEDTDCFDDFEDNIPF